MFKNFLNNGERAIGRERAPSCLSGLPATRKKFHAATFVFSKLQDTLKNIGSTLNHTTIAAIVISLLAANPSYADSCNFTNLNFGISQEKLKAYFKLEMLDVATTGEASIPMGAPEVCKDLPENAVVEFTLIDNKFVQIMIKNPNTTSSLLDYAKKTFGEMDNKETDPKKIKPGEKIKLGLWAKNDDYSIVYTSYTAGSSALEKLSITSKKYKELFDGANKTKSQAIDDYLKENKLGAYSTSPQNKSGKVVTETEQDKSNNQDIHKDKKLKENDNNRGFHYEKK